MTLCIRPRPTVRPVEQTERQPTTWYFSSTGSSSNTGKSPSSPFANSDDFYRDIYGGLRGGDRILFKGTITDRFYIANDAILPGSRKPVVFGSYGGGRATIQASDTSSPIINTIRCSVAVEDLILIGSGYATSEGTAVSFYADTSSNIRNCRVRNCHAEEFKFGIGIGTGDSGSSYTNILISSSTFTKIRFDGIQSYGSTPEVNQGLIRYCTFSSVTGSPGFAGETEGNAVKLGNFRDTIVEHCVADGTGGIYADGANAFWFYNSRRCTIRYSKVSNFIRETGSADGGAFGLDIGCHDSSIHDCEAYNCDGSGLLLMDGDNNAAYGNIIVNCGQKSPSACIHVVGGLTSALTTNVRVYNNTVYFDASTIESGTPPGFKNDKTGNTGVVFNNIFATTSAILVESLVSSTGVEFYNNVYYPSSGDFKIKWGSANYTTLASWRTATGKEILSSTPTGIRINPLLVNPGGTTRNDYKLQSPNALFAEGLAFSLFGVTPPTTDIYGNTYNATTPSIGADQSIVTDATLVPIAEPATLLFYDTFTGTSGAGIASRNPDIGSPWVKRADLSTSTAFGAVISNAGRARSSGAATTGTQLAWFEAGLAPDADHYIECDYFIVSNNAITSIALVTRLSNTNPDNCYGILYQTDPTPGIRRFLLFKRTNGSASILATFNADLANGSSGIMRLECRSTSKKLIVNDVERGTTTDNVFATGGTVGARWSVGASVGSGDGVGIHADAIRVGLL